MKKTPTEISNILVDIDAGMDAIIVSIPESEFVRQYLPLLANLYNADSEALDIRPWISRVGGHNRSAHIVSDSNPNEILFDTPSYFPRVSITPAAKPIDAVTTAKRTEKVDPNAHEKAANAIFNENAKLTIHSPGIAEQWNAIFMRYGITVSASGATPPPSTDNDSLDIKW